MKRERKKIHLRLHTLMAYYTISKRWDQVKTIHRDDWETIREDTNTKDFMLYFFSKSPCHTPLSSPLNFLSRCPSLKEHDVLYGTQALHGNHFLTLRPLLPKPWSLAWWLVIWAARAVGAQPGITQSIWRSRLQLPFHSAGSTLSE